jgi:hopanoid biosynthesis associated protein HpnK
MASRRVIVTADDFGLAIPVNEAVERAHREGVLTTASLMVAEAAVDDAVARARALPGLRVGLHVVVVDGRPVLPPEQIPDLVDEDGMLTNRLASAGFRYFFHPRIRRQLEAEIRAQFEAFRATGLRFDHVNAQCHMHLHPTVFGIIVKVARAYGRPPMRIPWEPFGPSWRATHDARGLRLLGELRPGVTEIFFHAATRHWPGMTAALETYRLEDELAALTSPDVARVLRREDTETIAFGDLIGSHAR